MKKFKRLLSAALCAALIAISAVCGAGISAEETETANTAIEATPLSNWAVTRNYVYISINDHEVIQPLGFTNAKGIKIKAVSGKGTGTEFGNIKSSGLYIGPKYPETTGGNYYDLPSDSDGILVYVETKEANNIVLNLLFMDGNNAERVFTPKVGEKYSFAALGDENWAEGTITAGGFTGSRFFGSFGFDEPFKGYVKIPFASFANDGGHTIDKGTYKLKEVKLQFQTLGETYETGAVAGPFMLITKDSDSTKINVPSDYKTDHIEVKTVNIGTVRADQSNFNIIQNSNSYCLSSETSVEVTGNVGNSNTVNFLMKPSIPLAPRDSEGFIIYLKTEKANDLAFSLEYEQKSWKFGWSPVMYLKPGQKVSVRKSTSDLWEEKEVVEGVTGNNVIYGKLTFTDAFEGYIRIPYSALNNDSKFTPNRDITIGAISRITQIACRFKGIGGTADNGGYGDITVGLEGYITADSISGEFTASAPEYSQGDVNNDWSVDATDIAELRKYLLGISAEVNEVTANVNNDVNGTVDITDLVELNDIKP